MISHRATSPGNESHVKKRTEINCPTAVGYQLSSGAETMAVGRGGEVIFLRFCRFPPPLLPPLLLAQQKRRFFFLFSPLAHAVSAAFVKKRGFACVPRTTSMGPIFCWLLHEKLSRVYGEGCRYFDPAILFCVPARDRETIIPTMPFLVPEKKEEEAISNFGLRYKPFLLLSIHLVFFFSHPPCYSWAMMFAVT